MHQCSVREIYRKQREQTEIRYVQNGGEALICLNSPLTKSFEIINETLMIFDQKKKKVVLNRPIQLGVTILEYAKLIMFSYNDSFVVELILLF